MNPINHAVFDQVEQAGKLIVVVTKYFDKPQTESIQAELRPRKCVLGWGENRTQALAEKALVRAETHFIGRLQSRQLRDVADYCGTIHSLAALKHAHKLDTLIEQDNYSKMKVFVQVNVADDPGKEGINPSEVPSFLEALTALNHLDVVGLSSMGWGTFTPAQKVAEFKALIALRDRFLPAGLTSAGTSRDYPLALESGIDIVRVGKGILTRSF